MRRFAVVAVMTLTGYLLIATSPARVCPGAAESVTLVSRTTCGPDGEAVLSVDTSCRVTNSNPDAGLPPGGSVSISMSTTPLLQSHVYLEASILEGTGYTSCQLSPNDGGTGYDVRCNTNIVDAGSTSCSGTLTVP